jgi:peptidoglycan/xylan/chitin deacetylase (PgdA/CDA1 family)
MGRTRKAIKRVLQVAIPTRYVVWRHVGDGHPLYLTFDDGPNPEFTPQVLDILDNFDVKATFFLIGERAEQHRDIVEDIVSRGHSIGNHSYTHQVLPDMKTADYANEIKRTRELLHGLCGTDITMFRPPKGLVTAGGLAYLLKHGLQTVLWSIDSMDYLRQSGETVVTALAKARPSGGDIILMHDDNPFTIKALPEVVERVHASGVACGRMTQ